MSQFANLLDGQNCICNEVIDYFCFMVVFQYGMQVHQNNLSHRILINGKFVVPGILVKRLNILKQSYHVARNLKKLGLEKNLYTPGHVFSNFTPQKGKNKGEKRGKSRRSRNLSLAPTGLVNSDTV